MSILENKFVVSTGITIVVVILFQILLAAFKIPWWPSIPIGFVTAVFLHLMFSRIQAGETEKGLSLMLPGLAAILGTAVSFGFVAWAMSHIAFTNIPKTQEDWDNILRPKSSLTSTPNNRFSLPDDVLCTDGEPAIISIDRDERYMSLTVTYRTSNGSVATITYRTSCCVMPNSFVWENKCNK